MTTDSSAVRRGTTASIVASVMFGVLFFIPPLLEPMGPNEIAAWRILTTVPIILLLALSFGLWGDIRAVFGRLRRRLRLVPVVILNGALLAVQLWMFGWAPQSGHGLDLALGYLLLPLVMVVVGVLLHRERMSALRVAAVVAAAVGVAVAVIAVGGISWATVAVALGYPVYFTIRRHIGFTSVGALLCEILAMTPVALWLVLQPDARAVIEQHPTLWWGIVALGLIGGVAIVLYLVASALLPFGLFGLLSYLEPVLLVVVSVTLLGEAFAPVDAFVYGPIVVALVLVGVEGLRRRPANSPSVVE